MFPLSGLVTVGRQLAKKCHGKIRPVAKALSVHEKVIPTLRCGVAIVHIQEPFSLIRQYAKEAESFAKGEAGKAGQGNALGLDLRIRAGHRIGFRLRFDQEEDFQALERWFDAYSQGKLPARIAYDVGEIARRIKTGELPDEAAEPEFDFLLMRSRQSGGAGKISLEIAGELKKRLAFLMLAEGNAATGELQRLSDELILARWLSARREAEVSV